MVLHIVSAFKDAIDIVVWIQIPWLHWGAQAKTYSQEHLVATLDDKHVLDAPIYLFLRLIVHYRLYDLSGRSF